MLTRTPIALFAAALVLVPLACDDDAPSASPAADAAPDARADAGVLPRDTAPDSGGAVPCDPSRRPVVMVHGFLASGDTWAKHVQRFATNGMCLTHLRVLDWDSLGDRDDAVAALDALIDALLAATGATTVDLAGHSAGGGVGYSYLSDPARAAKVAHYAHVASNVNAGPAGPAGAEVPTLNLWSSDDLVIQAPGDIPGATNVTLTGADHLEVASTAESFAAIYAFFNDSQAPETVVIGPEPAVTVSGKALILGTNAPMAGAAIAIYEVDAATGARRDAPAVATLTAGPDGSWGPVPVLHGAHYEFSVVGASPDDRPVHYYREPFLRSNPLVYLRGLPPADTLAGVLLSEIPFADDHAVLVNFTGSQAVIAGRDTLSIDAIDLSTEALASADQTAIAFFLYDADGDGLSGGAPVDTFGAFPFLNGADVYLPASGTSSLTFNGRTLNVPRWPSGSEGAVVVVFD